MLRARVRRRRRWRVAAVPRGEGYQGGNRSRTRSLTTSPPTRDPCGACRMDRLGGIGIHRCSEIVPYYHSLILLQSYTGVDSTLCAPFVYHLGCVGLCGDIGGASRTPVAEGGGALWKARRSISPREKNGEKTQCGQCAERRQRPWMSAAGRPVTRLGAVPRAIAPPMASKDRN